MVIELFTKWQNVYVSGFVVKLFGQRKFIGQECE